jgi:hypothetical protein
MVLFGDVINNSMIICLFLSFFFLKNQKNVKEKNPEKKIEKKSRVVIVWD